MLGSLQNLFLVVAKWNLVGFNYDSFWTVQMWVYGYNKSTIWITFQSKFSHHTGDAFGHDIYKLDLEQVAPTSTIWTFSFFWHESIVITIICFLH